jgi:phenylalanine-4-hydroxylase
VDHPGAHDLEYLRRRATIAALGESYLVGDPIPVVAYSEEEDAIWREVSHELKLKHRRLACKEYLLGEQALVLPGDRVPQLAEVDARVHELSGFHIRPVSGLVPTREFYGSLAERVFLSTQYVRHPSVPYYTPEPDIIHEIIGHANMLASAKFAALHQVAGQASARTTSEEALQFFSRVFWFSLEFGVVYEEGELKAYGAGLLSSYGEIDVFREAEIRDWDLLEMGMRDYDITRYQPVLYAAASSHDLLTSLGAFFEEYGEEWYRLQFGGG